MTVAGGDIPAARAAAHTADDVARSSCIPQSAEGGCLLQHFWPWQNHDSECVEPLRGYGSPRKSDDLLRDS